ncbi:MAG: hypothetical protein JXR97_07495 [Planctomycetes bacterium]|nr:hypothetical protein [Planctomycetota bacterium]
MEDDITSMLELRDSGFTRTLTPEICGYYLILPIDPRDTEHREEMCQIIGFADSWEDNELLGYRQIDVHDEYSPSMDLAYVRFEDGECGFVFIHDLVPVRN